MIIVVRQLGGKNPPHWGTIPFWLYIVPTDLVSVFLDVGNLQITYKDLPTRFSSFFLQNSYIAKISEISFSFVEEITCIIRKLIKNYI